MISISNFTTLIYASKEAKRSVITVSQRLIDDQWELDRIHYTRKFTLATKALIITKNTKEDIWLHSLYDFDNVNIHNMEKHVGTGNIIIPIQFVPQKIWKILLSEETRDLGAELFLKYFKPSYEKWRNTLPNVVETG